MDSKGIDSSSKTAEARTRSSDLNPNAEEFVPPNSINRSPTSVLDLEVQHIEAQRSESLSNEERNLSTSYQISPPISGVNHRMELEYLCETFPDVSEDFIIGIYETNGCDVELSTEIITQLKSSSPAKFLLPDYLGIAEATELSGSSSPELHFSDSELDPVLQ